MHKKKKKKKRKNGITENSPRLIHVGDKREISVTYHRESFWVFILDSQLSQVAASNWLSYYSNKRTSRNLQERTRKGIT